jgi:hypothetical protein
MNPLVIFLCSYLPDLERVRRLHTSIVKFNIDRLQLYIAVPKADLPKFQHFIADPSINWMTQEDVFHACPSARIAKYEDVPGGHMQQLVKSEAWRLGIGENLLVVDSDCKFIRPFQTTDFLTLDGTPYSVVCGARTISELAARLRKPKIWTDWLKTSDLTRDYFGNTSDVRHSFDGAPFIWSARVWSDLAQLRLEPAGQTLLDLIRKLGSEFVIYGEALTALKSIPIKLHDPYFRLYLYEQDVWSDRSQGIDESVLAKSYLGVTNQSNWEYWTDHRSYRKSLSSRVARTLRRNIAFVRWRLQSRD